MCSALVAVLLRILKLNVSGDLLRQCILPKQIVRSQLRTVNTTFRLLIPNHYITFRTWELCYILNKLLRSWHSNLIRRKRRYPQSKISFQYFSDSSNIFTYRGLPIATKCFRARFTFKPIFNTNRRWLWATPKSAKNLKPKIFISTFCSDAISSMMIVNKSFCLK